MTIEESYRFCEQVARSRAKNFYYSFVLESPGRIGHVAGDYLSFIALVGSLFVVSGGIHITVRGEATPAENVRLLLFGAVISNVLGTTGASMLLIRPWIRMNRYRITAHHIVFFIFIEILNQSFSERAVASYGAIRNGFQYVKTQVAEDTSQTPIGNPLKALGDEGGEMVLYKRKN